jgi:hypothetical protein
MAVAYISHFDFLREPSGLESASLLGNSGRLSSAMVAGATALPVTPTTIVTLAQFDRITLFDGPNTEVVQVASTVATGQASIPLLTGTQYVHAQYTPYCSDGGSGSLSDQIIDASTWLENICQQSLFQQTYTDTLRMPSMRAALDNAQQLAIRPRHFPVSSVASLSLKSSQSDSLTYDPAQAIIDGTAQVVYVPALLSTGGGSTSYSLLPTRSRIANMWVTVSYVAGYPAMAIPGDVREAVMLLLSDILAKRLNPSGAYETQMGKRRIRLSSTADTSGDSALVKRARQLLQNYSSEAY